MQIIQKKYPNVELLKRYNLTLQLYEIVIKDDEKIVNDEFEDFLYDIFEEKFYSKNENIYYYFLNSSEFYELKKELSENSASLI